MAASNSFLNSALSGAIHQVTGDWGTINVALFSGGNAGTEVTGGGYARQAVNNWSVAAGAQISGIARVNFAPTGMSWTYDTINLYGTGSTLLHYVAVSPTVVIAAGNTDSIAIIISGSG
jgi:hypothetical protein